MFGKKTPLVLLVFQLATILFLLLNIWISAKIFYQLKALGEPFEGLLNERLGIIALSVVALLLGSWNVFNLVKTIIEDRRLAAKRASSTATMESEES